MIGYSSDGNFKKTTKFLEFMKTGEVFNNLSSYGSSGVSALSSATPSDTGETAHSWSYEVKRSKGYYTIYWTNSHVLHGVNIAVIIQYGHGTGTGGYVAGRDYINPAMRPIFDRIATEIWRQVTSA